MAVNPPVENHGSPRILLIRRRYLGDLVLLGAIVRDLRRYSPNAHIAVITERAYAGVLAMNDDVNEVLAFPRSFFDWMALARQLWKQRFSAVFDFDNRDKTALIAWLSRATRRFALHHGERVHLGWMYTDCELVTASLSNFHLLDLHERLLDRAGVPVTSRNIALAPRKVDLEFARSLPALHELPVDRPRLLVHPGSRSSCRVWPAKAFAMLLDEVQCSGLASVTLVAGPAEIAFIDDIQQHATTPLTCLRQNFSIPQLGALLSTFDLLLCHDSGPMHLAAAVGTRVVALYGSQDRSVFAPIGDHHICLSPPLPCTNCLMPDLCIPNDSYRTYCVRHIRKEDVLRAIQQQLRTDATD